MTYNNWSKKVISKVSRKYQEAENALWLYLGMYVSVKILGYRNFDCMSDVKKDVLIYRVHHVWFNVFFLLSPSSSSHTHIHTRDPSLFLSWPYEVWVVHGRKIYVPVLLIFCVMVWFPCFSFGVNFLWTCSKLLWGLKSKQMCPHRDLPLPIKVNLNNKEWPSVLISLFCFCLVSPLIFFFFSQGLLDVLKCIIQDNISLVTGNYWCSKVVRI